jgi:UDP-2-acetamido-3-amino-2,3-dideoxy-glucuronate N-acetyltransferase
LALVVGVPARQIGWVSRQGEPLSLPIKGHGEAECAASGERYVLRDGVCALVSELVA